MTGRSRSSARRRPDLHNVNGRALDIRSSIPFSRHGEQADLPIWVHPTRTAKFATMSARANRSTNLLAVRLALRDEPFMARVVFSGCWRSSRAQIITHTWRDGAVLRQRIGYGWTSSAADLGRGLHGDPQRMAKRPVDYFRMFYADTAVNGSRSATQCGWTSSAQPRAVRHRLPFDPEAGRSSSARSSRDDSLKLKDGDRAAYFATPSACCGSSCPMP